MPAVADLINDLLFLAIVQLAITSVAVAVDLGIVLRLVWFDMLREVPRGSFRYIGRGIAKWARDQAGQEDFDRKERLAMKARIVELERELARLKA